MKIEDYCISNEYTLLEAIKKIKNNKARGVVVTKDNKKVIGFISQGDILEAIISGVSEYAHISSILKPNFYYVKDKNDKNIVKIFKDKMITILPVVDDEYILQDIITLSDILQSVN